MATSALLAEGDSLYKAGDYEGSIENYTAAICLNRRSLQMDNRRVNATMNGGDEAIDDDPDTTETKVIHFRSLSRRSASYLALSKYKQAYADSRAALALYPHSDYRDDFTTSAPGVLPLEIDRVHDLVDRILAEFLGLDDHAHLDNLTRSKAMFLIENPHKTVKFVPGGCEVSELQLENMQDETSVLTQETCFRSIESGSTMTSKKTTSLCFKLDTIDETSTSEGVSEFFRTVCIEGLDDGLAIDLLREKLIVGNHIAKSKIRANAKSMRNDPAQRCLTKLLILARKSDENKCMMISGKYSALDAIIEAARMYPGSTEIQQEVCGILWSLSTKLQEHIALDSVCRAILDAMVIHVEVDTLQVKALGALKILSLHDVDKMTLRSQDAMCMVADAMLKHTCIPPIQSKGCVILDNLAVGESSQSVLPVSEKVVDAVLKGMLQHPSSLEVQKAACSALMSLASSAANVALIRRNSKSIASLKLALEWHARDVGDMISTLSKSLNIIDVSTSNFPSRVNFDQYDNRHNTSRLGLAKLAPRLGLRNFSIDLDLEDGDLG